MEKNGKGNFKSFRKVMAFLSMFAMLLGTLDPAFVMKAQAAVVTNPYPVTINFYDADQATLAAPNIQDDQSWNNYHVVVALKDKDSGEVVGWGYKNIPNINDAATQVIGVSEFWNMDTKEINSGTLRNAWHPFNNGNNINYGDYKISVRIYYGQNPDNMNNWDCGLTYADVARQRDTIDGYKFLSQTRSTPSVETKATATGAVVNIAKDAGTSYSVRLQFSPSATAITAEDNIYVLTTVKHKSGNYTYHHEQLITDGTSTTVDISVDTWEDNNGNTQANEKYSSSEESVSVKLVKVNAGEEPNMNMILSHTKCYDVEEGGDVLGYIVNYAGLDSQFSTTDYTTTDYDVINLTKIQPTADYTFLSVLGNSVNYGVVSNQVSQKGHSETNMAVKSYEANGNNLDPDLSGDGDTQVPGTFLVGEITGSNLRLGGNTPATAIVVTSDISKVTDDGKNTSVKLQMDKDTINATVDQMIQDMQAVSAQMAGHAATIHPQMVNGKLEIDTTDFPDGVTIYLDGDDYISAIQSDLGVSIKKNPNQLIVFNFKTTEEVTIGKVQVDYGNGYKNTNTETGQFGSEQNTAADQVAQQIVWNMASVKTATTNIAGGIFLMPKEDSVINLGGTSCGWGISAGLTNLGEGGEFHFVYRGLKQSQTVELEAHKLVDNKYPTDDQVFRFGVKKYNGTAFVPVQVDDPKHPGTKIDYVVSNEKYLIKIPATEMTPGINIYEIYEVGKDDSTAGSYTIDDTCFYAKFEVSTAGGNTVVTGAPAYYKTFNAGELSDPITKTNVVFKNASVSGTITVKKTVTGDPAPAGDTFPITLTLANANSDLYNNIRNSLHTKGVTLDTNVAGLNSIQFTDWTATVNLKDGEYVTLSGLLAGTTITASETVPAHYELTTAEAKRSAALGGTITLVNKYTADRGSLKVIKAVTGTTTSPRYDSQKKYKVNISFSQAGTYKVSVAGGTAVSTTFQANTAKQFSIAAGEDNGVVITEVPVGVTYTVTEEALSAEDVAAGYNVGTAVGTITYPDVTHKIVADTQSQVTVGNTYTEPKGKLTITKKVTGDTDLASYTSAVDTTLYTVNVKFDESGTYDVSAGDVAADGNFEANTPKQYTIKADQSIVIENVPVGVSYTVTEEALSAEKTAAGYAVGSITDNGQGSITLADTELFVNNTYTAPKGGLTIKKVMTGSGYDAEKEYQINVKFDRSGTYTVQETGKAAQEVAFVANTAKTYKIKAKADESVVITNVPVGVGYTITENNLSSADKAAGYSKGSITDGGTGSVTGAQKLITVTNNYEASQKGSIKITKNVTGDTDYPDYATRKDTQTYKVGIKFTVGGTYTVEQGNTSAPYTFSADTWQYYYIKAGESVEISNIPIPDAGAKEQYEVTEDTTGLDAARFASAGITNASGTVDTAGQLINVNVNNTYTSPKGQLTVTKQVDINGSGYNTDQTYDVNVKFDHAGTYTVNVGGSETPVEFAKNEVKTYSLKNNESVVIKGVPVGVGYTVTEADLSEEDQILGYTKDTILVNGVAGNTGAISDVPATATVKNTYTAPTKGKLKVTKNVAGDVDSATYVDNTYIVRVSFNWDGTWDGKCTVIDKGVTNTNVTFEKNHSQEYQLKKGESVEFTEIPLGVTYTVTEDAISQSNQELGYTFDDITNGTGTIAVQEAQVTVNNRYTAPVKGKLTVTKNVEGDTDDPNFEPGRKFRVGVKFDKAGAYKVTYNGSTKTVNFAENVVQYYQLQHGASVVIDNIPGGVGYTVTEPDLTETEKDLGYSKGTIEGATGTISATPSTATVKNNYAKPQMGSLLITKTVTGDTGSLNYNANKTFKVEVTFSKTGTYDVKQGSTTTETGFTAGTAHVFVLKAGETVEISKILVGTTYTVTEPDLSVLDVAAGYAKDTVENATGAIATTPVTATVKNTYTKKTAGLTLKKTVANPGNAELSLPSSFKVAVRNGDNKYAQDVNGTFGDTKVYFDVSTGDVEPVVINGLEVGQVYTIEENRTAAEITGFDLDVAGDDSVKITMVEGGKTANVINTYRTTTPSKKVVAISKTAKGQTAELAGATLRVKAQDGSYELTWVSNGSVRVLNLEVGTYTLEELEAPEGYKTAAPITFVVTEAGNVEIGGTNAPNNIVKMEDELNEFDVKFSKKALGGGEELANAILEVKSTDGSYSESWRSDGSLHTLRLKVGKYTLTETQAPANYAKAETIAFELTADGKVVVNGQYVDENTVTMYDDLYRGPIKFSKIDALNSEEIAGATLVLYRIKTDGTLEQLDQWISSATEIYTFTLEAGNYAIKETVAPDGYELVESLVKFKLNFDTNGKAVIKVTEGPGVYDAQKDSICFKDDPIKVSGLIIEVEDEVTGKPVPDAVVEVTEPDGTTKEYTTDTNGKITKYSTGAVLGAYRIRVKSVPQGYTVTVNKEQTATVVKGEVTEAIAKTNTNTGALTIQVLDKVTNLPVPNAVVEVTEPDNSVKEYTTDSQGRVNEYMSKDESGHYKAQLGTYKIKVKSVPEGYSVDTGEIAEVSVIVGQVTEHIAKIVTTDAEDDDDDDDTPSTPVSSSALQEETVTSTTKRSLTGGARRTVTESAMSLKTGETNLPFVLFGGSLFAMIAGAAAYVFAKKKK